ncbi:hypothetical protein J4416_04705 [Candidatus Pacearchaeota archaeon]|nr:hypothetical protein [Candidatus Pacearchaeota archaeon]
MEEIEISNKVNLIEKELFSLKLLLLKLSQKKKQENLCLEGRLKGINITEEDIEESKFSLFK